MSCENCEEGAYVIDKLAKLLAEIAVIVNGPEPHDTLWSYHDLPEKVRALKQAPPAQPDVARLANLILEAGDVLEAVRDSGAPLPPNWRWPLADELHGMAAMLAAARKGEP